VSIRFWITAVFVLPLSLSAEVADLPDAPGKATVLKRCSGCHPADVLVGRVDTPKNWAGKVESMINRGAELTPEEVTEVVAYLNANFALTSVTVQLPDGPGKAELQKVCGTCHLAELVANRDRQAGRRYQWLDTIDRMLARGAKGTPAELELITDYLANNFAYIPVRSYLPDGPGKQTTERVCGPCHGPTMLGDRRRTGRAWSRTVENMIGRGAIATESEQ
jgi:mono/diheme cytochrome c family protein